MASLGETAVYIRLSDTLGHFSPRWTWLKWFIYALQLSSSLCSNQSTGCSERKFTLQKFIPSYPVYCIVKILVNLLIGYSFFLCSSHSSECHSYVFKCYVLLVCLFVVFIVLRRLLPSKRPVYWTVQRYSEHFCGQINCWIFCRANSSGYIDLRR